MVRYVADPLANVLANHYRNATGENREKFKAELLKLKAALCCDTKSSAEQPEARQDSTFTA